MRNKFSLFILVVNFFSLFFLDLISVAEITSSDSNKDILSNFILIPNFSSQIPKQEITFREINPTKYEVRVRGAREPFWLVFSESFDNQWKIYLNQKPETRNQKPEEIVAEYSKLGVKEAKHTIRFTPEDISYIFKKPLHAKHRLVNGYANGWYIEPKKLGLGENFTLILYFLPQSLFYLGLGISGLTLLGCVGYLGIGILKDRLKR